MKTQKKKRKMIVDQDRIRAAAMRGVPPPPMGLFLQICSHSDDILVQACARCKCSAISIVQCIFGALFLGLGCNIFLVLRLWFYALSATSRRLATAVAHLLYTFDSITEANCFRDANRISDLCVSSSTPICPTTSVLLSNI